MWVGETGPIVKKKSFKKMLITPSMYVINYLIVPHSPTTHVVKTNKCILGVTCDIDEFVQQLSKATVTNDPTPPTLRVKCNATKGQL